MDQEILLCVLAQVQEGLALLREAARRNKQ